MTTSVFFVFIVVCVSSLTFEHFPGVGEAMTKLNDPSPALLALMAKADPTQVNNLITKVEDLRDDCSRRKDDAIKECEEKKGEETEAQKEFDDAVEAREVCTEELVVDRETVERLEKEEVEARVVVTVATKEEENAEKYLEMCKEEIEKRVPEIEECNAVLTEVRQLLVNLLPK